MTTFHLGSPDGPIVPIDGEALQIILYAAEWALRHQVDPLNLRAKTGIEHTLLAYPELVKEI